MGLRDRVAPGGAEQGLIRSTAARASRWGRSAAAEDVLYQAAGGRRAWSHFADPKPPSFVAKNGGMGLMGVARRCAAGLTRSERAAKIVEGVELSSEVKHRLPVPTGYRGVDLRYEACPTQWVTHPLVLLR